MPRVLQNSITMDRRMANAHPQALDGASPAVVETLDRFESAFKALNALVGR
jgi:hypothetical protein